MIAFSRGNQESSVSRFPKHFFSTSIEMDAAVDAPGDRLFPILFHGAREELFKGRELMARTLQNLANEIFGQIDIVACDVEQRNDVVEGQRREQVREFTTLEEARGEACIGTEQQRVRATDNARIQMRHRHRRRTRGGLAIDLGMMPMTYSVDIATQPDAA